jgi:hypothetical protein
MSGTTCLSSGLLSADTLIWTGRGTVNALTVFTDGTNAATVTLYDNTTNSGTAIAQLICPGSQRTESQAWNLAIRCANGIYADVTGTGATFIVHYGA